MKSFLLLWFAKYGNSSVHPCRVQAKDWWYAVNSHIYSRSPELRWLVIDDGGQVVWNGTFPAYGHEVGQVIGAGDFEACPTTVLTDAGDIDDFFASYLNGLDLPHVQPNESVRSGKYASFRSTIKSIHIVGSVEKPYEVYLSTAERPDFRYDTFYRAPGLASPVLS